MDARIGPRTARSGGRGDRAGARSGPGDLSHLAIPIAVTTVVLLVTAPIWLVYLMVAGIVVVWSLGAPLGLLGAAAMLALPLVISTLLAVANLRCGRDADRVLVSARSEEASDEARRRRAWSTVGLVAAVVGVVAYGVFLVVSASS